MSIAAGSRPMEPGVTLSALNRTALFYDWFQLGYGKYDMGNTIMSKATMWPTAMAALNGMRIVGD